MPEQPQERKEDGAGAGIQTAPFPLSQFPVSLPVHGILGSKAPMENERPRHLLRIPWHPRRCSSCDHYKTRHRAIFSRGRWGRGRDSNGPFPPLESLRTFRSTAISGPKRPWKIIDQCILTDAHRYNHYKTRHRAIFSRGRWGRGRDLNPGQGIHSPLCCQATPPQPFIGGMPVQSNLP